MGEGTVFSLFVSSHLDGEEGYPIPGLDRGVPPGQVWIVGYPQPGLDGRGTPWPGLDGGETWGTPSQFCMVGGTPSQVWMVEGYLGYPLARSGWGYPWYCHGLPTDEVPHRSTSIT